MQSASWADTVLSPLAALYVSFIYALGMSVYAPLARRYSSAAVNLARAASSLPFFLAVGLAQGLGQSDPSGVAGLSDQAARGFGAVDAASLGWTLLAALGTQGLADVLLLASMRSLGVPVALAIASSYPLWSALWAWGAMSQPLGARQGFGLVLAVSGVIMLVLLGGRAERSDERSDPPSTDRPSPVDAKPRGAIGRPIVGLALAFAVSLLWALGVVAVSEAGQRLSGPVTNTLRMGFAALLCPLFGLATRVPRDKLVLPWSALRGCLWILGLELVMYAAYVYCLTHGPVAVGATLAGLSPVVAVLLAWLLGRERFAWLRLAAVVVTTAGALLLV